MIEKIIVVLIIAALYGMYISRIDNAVDKIIQSMHDHRPTTDCTLPNPAAPVTCGVCRWRDKQSPRMCNHSLGIDVAINPWDSCEHGEREVEE